MRTIAILSYLLLFQGCVPREAAPAEVESVSARGVAAIALIYADENSGRLPSLIELERFAADKRIQIEFDSSMKYMPKGTEYTKNLPENYCIVAVPSKTGVWLGLLSGDRIKIQTKKK